MKLRNMANFASGRLVSFAICIILIVTFGIIANEVYKKIDLEKKPLKKILNDVGFKVHEDNIFDHAKNAVGDILG